MEDPKDNARRSFIKKERTEKGKLEDSLPEETEADFPHEGNTKKIPHSLQLNMEKTKEEFEILYTRL